MGIRKKILLYFSLTTISLSGIVLLFIYTLFAEYREEEFQQRQKEKIKSTLIFLSEIKRADNELTEAIDRLNIHDLFDEKLLIFNKQKELIYSSIDDTPIKYSNSILKQLSPEKEWYESKEDLYDIVGLYFHNQGNVYYGISKAYDKFGYSKLNYLKYILFASFFVIAVAVILTAYFLSNRITQPLIYLTQKIYNYNFESNYIPIEIKQSKDEISILAQRFNELMEKISEAFSFQKHTIHHISHQLKTPIAILVSELEKIERNTSSLALKKDIQSLIVKTKSLGNIINILLDISKIESGRKIKKQLLRLDELIFDTIAELNMITPDFHFEVNYTPKQFSESKLEINANQELMKQAFLNVLSNCITYSDNAKATIIFDCTELNKLKIIVSNSGIPISSDEEKFLFNHFFRGQNSQDKTGFGLGLVLSKKILEIHSATIQYSSPSPNMNAFEITFSLS
jgi:signal transduction histidine kinase